MSQGAAAVRPADPRTPLLEVVAAAMAATWRRRKVIAVPLLVLPVVGLAIGMVAPRSYETRMTLLVQDAGRALPNIQDMAVGTNLKDRMEALRAILASRRVMLGVAQDIGLLPADADRPRQDAVVRSLAQAVNVQLIGTEVLEFTYRAPYPQGMSVVLNRVGQRFVEAVLAPGDSSTRDSVEFLKRQLDAASTQLTAAETALGDYRGRNVQQLPEQRGANVTRLAQVRDALNDHQVRLAGAESEFASLRSRLVQTDPMVGRLEQDIVAATSEVANLRSRYTPEHSSVQAAERRLRHLEEMRRDMLQAARAPAVGEDDLDRLWNMAATIPTGKPDGEQAPMLVSQVVLLQQARGKVEQLRAETENLRTTVAEIERRLASSGEVERRLRELERDLATKSDLVGELNKRYERARVTNDFSRYQAPDRVKVLDQPVDPTAPMRPITLLFTLAGIAGGLLLGTGLAAALEATDPTVRRAREMERISGVRVLARVPPLEA